jgi:hypothetical protein
MTAALSLGGRSWRVTSVPALLAEYESKPPIGRQRFFLGCCTCAMLCTISNPCRCCATIGKTFGAKRVRGLQSLHDRFPAGVVLALLRGAA